MVELPLLLSLCGLIAERISDSTKFRKHVCLYAGMYHALDVVSIEKLYNSLKLKTAAPVTQRVANNQLESRTAVGGMYWGWDCCEADLLDTVAAEKTVSSA